MDSTAHTQHEQPAGGPTIQVFIKAVNGETTSLSVSQNITIADLRTLVLKTQSSPSPTSSSTPQPQTNTIRLIHSGRHLNDPSATLSSLSILPGSTINLSQPIRGGGGAPNKKPKCNFKDCRERAQPIVGDCGFCKGRFCARHRMLESHACDGLEDCKSEAKERNREQLEKERTRPQATV